MATLPDGKHEGILVCAEVEKGKIKNVGFELVSKSRSLADILKTEVCAVCFGDHIDNPGQLIAYGADKVYVVDDSAFASNQEDYYVKQLTQLIQEHKPEIVLVGATPLGRSFIPRVAAILKTGLTADCTGLEVDAEKRLL